MFKRIDHVEIVASDFGRSLDFYTNVLGFKVKMNKKIDMPPIEEIAFVELNGTVLELLSIVDAGQPTMNPWKAGYRMMAIEVEDMDKALEYLESKGVEIATPPVVLGTSKRAEIKDPDGLLIELRQW